MAAKRKALGRGLDALIDTNEGSDRLEGGAKYLPTDQLEPNRYQPRASFDEAGLDELAQSIQTQGVVQPIIVTRVGDKYRIIAGERRWRAARKVGLQKVPVVVRDIQDDQQMLELALVENVQRADLNAIEEAEAYRTLGNRFKLSQEEIAKKVGKGRTTITNVLRLLRLPTEIQNYLREGQLTAGQARPLLALAGKSQQIEVAELAVERGLTARELEALVNLKKAKPKEKSEKKPKVEEDVHTRAAIERLTRSLQTKVEIIRKKRSGRIQIYFSSEDELIRIYETIIQDEKNDG